MYLIAYLIENFQSKTITADGSKKRSKFRPTNNQKDYSPSNEPKRDQNRNADRNAENHESTGLTTVSRSDIRISICEKSSKNEHSLK